MGRHRRCCVDLLGHIAVNRMQQIRNRISGVDPTGLRLGADSWNRGTPVQLTPSVVVVGAKVVDGLGHH
jgi:hypothetical protein